MSNNTFLSVSQFVEFINEHKQQILEWGKITDPFCILGCLLYFEPNATFKNKFNKACIKPIAITFNGLDKKFTISHNKVLELFDNLQPIITFNETMKRTINRNEPLQYLNVSFEQKEYNNVLYYPADIYVSLNKTLKTKIIESKVIDKQYNEDEQVEEGSEFMV